jgi:hypothetical protein
VRRGSERDLTVVREVTAATLAVVGEEAASGNVGCLTSAVGLVEWVCRGKVGQVAPRRWWRRARGAYLLWTGLVHARSSCRRPALRRLSGSRSRSSLWRRSGKEEFVLGERKHMRLLVRQRLRDQMVERQPWFWKVPEMRWIFLQWARRWGQR